MLESNQLHISWLEIALPNELNCLYVFIGGAAKLFFKIITAQVENTLKFLKAPLGLQLVGINCGSGQTDILF